MSRKQASQDCVSTRFFNYVSVIGKDNRAKYLADALKVFKDEIKASAKDGKGAFLIVFSDMSAFVSIVPDDDGDLNVLGLTPVDMEAIVSILVDEGTLGHELIMRSASPVEVLEKSTRIILDYLLRPGHMFVKA